MSTVTLTKGEEMPDFYDKLFKPSSKKGVMQRRRSHWIAKDNENMLPVSIKDVEDHMIRQFFKTKKKSLANQKVKHGK
jgi:hypothetical protein